MTDDFPEPPSAEEQAAEMEKARHQDALEKDAVDRAATDSAQAREAAGILHESLARLDALRVEYADNPDKHVLAEARGIAEALGGPDVTRIPLASAASEYVKGNVSRTDLEILAGKNERAASHSHDKPEDRSQGNDLGR